MKADEGREQGAPLSGPAGENLPVLPLRSVSLDSWRDGLSVFTGGRGSSSVSWFITSFSRLRSPVADLGQGDAGSAFTLHSLTTSGTAGGNKRFENIVPIVYSAVPHRLISSSSHQLIDVQA